MAPQRHKKDGHPAPTPFVWILMQNDAPLAAIYSHIEALEKRRLLTDAERKAREEQGPKYVKRNYWIEKVPLG